MWRAYKVKNRVVVFLLTELTWDIFDQSYMKWQLVLPPDVLSSNPWLIFFFPLFYLLNMVLKIFLIFMIEWQNNTIGSWRHCDMEKAIFKDLELSFWEYIGDEEVKETVSEGNMDDPKSFSFNVLTSYLQKDSFFKNFLFSCKWVNVCINATSSM